MMRPRNSLITFLFRESDEAENELVTFPSNEWAMNQSDNLITFPSNMRKSDEADNNRITFLCNRRKSNEAKNSLTTFPFWSKEK